uniref:Uncharacterized protein n=1 Tax=uncultured Desulfobacterium sp. TaxID=201089 RepID=E1YMM7_9BACT|nr:unknown protein [uncultured Desulfobacterium sp.]
MSFYSIKNSTKSAYYNFIIINGITMLTYKDLFSYIS